MIKEHQQLLNQIRAAKKTAKEIISSGRDHLSPIYHQLSDAERMVDARLKDYQAAAKAEAEAKAKAEAEAVVITPKS